MNFIKTATPLVFSTLLALATGCGSDDEPKANEYFASTASYQIYFTLQPDPPARAPDNTMTLTVTGPDGAPLIGALITAQPSVLVNNHGAPRNPVVQDMGDGTYQMTGLNFDVGGRWRMNMKVGEPGKAAEPVNPDDPIFFDIN